MSMENDATAERKRKLQAMRDKAVKSKGDAGSEGAECSEPIKRLKFRNYQPRDQSLATMTKSEDGAAEEAVVPSGQNETANDGNLLKKELRMHDSEELNILPKSTNWDIKKSFEPKLEKLRRRTQRAIVDFLREKLSSATTDSEGDDSELEGEGS